MAILERRHRVAERYCQGRKQFEIARELGMHVRTVSKDLAAIRKRWLRASLAAYDARKAEELARIDHLERVAWQAWERSCRDAETMKAGMVKGRRAKDGTLLPPLERTEKLVRGQCGDPRFLERIAWCIEKRCEILGILNQPGNGPSTSVTVVGGIDLDVVLGRKPALPVDRLDVLANRVPPPGGETPCPN